MTPDELKRAKEICESIHWRDEWVEAARQLLPKALAEIDRLNDELDERDWTREQWAHDRIDEIARLREALHDIWMHGESEEQSTKAREALGREHG